jgi:ABC-2 type transport system ATP-binding protein
MISVAGLTKRYGDFTAVAGSDFSVASGEVFGLVGPNGAGKTTTLKILSGLIEPSGGTATVAGYDVEDPEMRSVLGFLPEESPLYEDMTPLSYLRFFADLYDVPRGVATDRIDAALSRLDLNHRERRLGDMSKGMKRKVTIARSLINDPDVLIYDEPASGLDPLTTNEVLQFVGELAAADKTVLFSAHNLYHVEDVCDRVIVMIDGEIVARGTVAEIRATHGTTEYHVYTTVPVDSATNENAAIDGATIESATNGTEPTTSPERDATNDEESEAIPATPGAHGTVKGDTDRADVPHRARRAGTTRANAARNGHADMDGRSDVSANADGSDDADSTDGTTTERERADGSTDRYETVVPDMAAVETVRERATERGGTVVDIRTVEPSFEEIFLAIARPSAGAGS